MKAEQRELLQRTGKSLSVLVVVKQRLEEVPGQLWPAATVKVALLVAKLVAKKSKEQLTGNFVAVEFEESKFDIEQEQPGRKVVELPTVEELLAVSIEEDIGVEWISSIQEQLLVEMAQLDIKLLAELQEHIMPVAELANIEVKAEFEQADTKLFAELVRVDTELIAKFVGLDTELVADRLASIHAESMLDITVAVESKPWAELAVKKQGKPIPN